MTRWHGGATAAGASEVQEGVLRRHRSDRALAAGILSVRGDRCLRGGRSRCWRLPPKRERVWAERVDADVSSKKDASTTVLGGDKKKEMFEADVSGKKRRRPECWAGRVESVVRQSPDGVDLAGFAWAWENTFPEHPMKADAMANASALHAVVVG